MIVDITNMDTLVRGYITSTLQEKFPLIDTSLNSPFDDMFVKPMIELLKPLIEKLNRMEIKMNLNNAADMTEEELDDIGNGNYLIPRHSGSSASTALTLSFANLNLEDTLFSLRVPAGTTFATSSGLKFQNKIDIPILAEDLKRNYNKSKMVYEIDIPVESVGIGSLYNVGVGEIIICLNQFSTALVGVTNKAALEDGKDKEDNVSYADRIRQYYISRQLGTKPGYISFIRESFPEVQDIYVAGYLDEYMDRDLLKVWDDSTGTVTEKHIGGKVDIYIKGCIYSQTDASLTANTNVIIVPVDYDKLVDSQNIESNFTIYNLTDESKQPAALSIERIDETQFNGKYTGKVKIVLDNTDNKSFDASTVSNMKLSYIYMEDGIQRGDEIYFDIGVSKIVLAIPVKSISSIITDNGALDNISSKYVLNQSGIIGTTYEYTEMVLQNIDDIPNGTNLNIQYTINDTLTQLGNIFNQEEFRVVTTDILCREAVPVPVNIQFRVKPSNHRKLDEDIKAKIQASVISFFNSYTLGSQIEESDLVSWIYNDSSIKESLQYIALPFDVFYIPQNILEEIPSDPNIIQAKDGVLPIQAIQYPILNVTRFKTTTI